jgi:hypothetical protein
MFFGSSVLDNIGLASVMEKLINKRKNTIGDEGLVIIKFFLHRKLLFGKNT